MGLSKNTARGTEVVDHAYIPVVASLPTSPVDGQEIIYQSAAMATDGVAWRFKYRAASSSSYKWEFIGGPAWYAQVLTSETTATIGSWVNLTGTNGPLITAPLAGDYIAQGQCRTDATTAPTAGYIGITNGDATAFNNAGVTLSAITNVGSNSQSNRLDGVAAATTIKLRYFIGGGGAASSCAFSNREITVTPIRVG